MITSKRLGCYTDPEDHRDKSLKTSFHPEILRSGHRSSHIDHTDLMTKVKDQGELGSCVGFATVAMKEWQQIKERSTNNKKHKEIDLSEQWVYYKCKEIDPWPNSEGTSIKYAMKIIQKEGIPPEHGWPYDENHKGKPKPWTKMIAKWTRSDKYYKVQSMTDLLDALQFIGPIVTGIVCFEEIFSPPPDGHIPLPSNPQNNYGGHAICLVGFDHNERLIKFKNSWGTSWGDQGYGYLPYRYVRDYAMSSWVSIDKKLPLEEVILDG